MPGPFDADLALLEATARRHIPVLPPRASVHLSAAVDALTDPLAPPVLSGLQPGSTADLAAVLRHVRRRLQHHARRADDPRHSVAAAVAARELTDALTALTPDRAGR